MKKISNLIKISVLLVALGCFSDKALAASGDAHIHYYKEQGYVDRTPTYTNSKAHLQNMGYTVHGYDNYGIGLIWGQLTNGKVFVVHNHGAPGAQLMSGSGEQITAVTTGTGKLAISSMSSGLMSDMKIAIFYGCKTGLVLSTTGNLPQQVVNKGATASVAWKVDTDINSVNEWNRLFFEKAQSDTIVESFRHADYWLEVIEGTTSANVMKNNRTEAGNIYATIY